MRATTKATFAGLVVWAAVFAASPASAQGASGCGITQAADAAVQRQIALLDAAKVDSSEFFNGANSCLGANLLDSLDLSNLIPTSFDFLGGAADQLINGLMQKAQQQAALQPEAKAHGQRRSHATVLWPKNAGQDKPGGQRAAHSPQGAHGRTAH